MTSTPPKPGIGNRLAPARFVSFLAIAIVVAAGGQAFLDWRHAIVIGFDVAAATFLLSCVPLFRRGNAKSMRAAAERNDANRLLLLVITAVVTAVVLVTIAAELAQSQSHDPATAGLVIVTLMLAWSFTTIVYALHYAHLFYSNDAAGKDRGGLDFPETKEPDYWDFLYFSATLGMTFQTSDVAIGPGTMRRTATFHSMAAFAFNIGVLAFTINILGS